ncbi:acyltransferase [Streptomyces sp. ISL-1]|uniref:acyltransferase family protein n=1 Tax=Streptomyces sp. ISL-1 TaxID=2817657 RepID=UPI001BE4ED04|nr:acyltransferase [Streptomyces sp. ISL-1]MBT2388405.1 acyltransferase [Streptomyces sp. ISL-1]
MSAPPVPTAPDASSSRLRSLTGMRFVASFMVLICHIGIVLVPRVQKPGLTWTEPYFYALGPTGVVFFFVLSGFVLTWAARPGDTSKLFWRRRLVKIYPNHLVTLGAALVLMLITGHAVTAANTVPTLFLVQAWIPDQEVVLNYASNAPTWSLACELLFYLAFPALLPLLNRIRAGRLWLWMGGVALLICALPFVALLLPEQPVMTNTDVPWWPLWFTYYFPISRMLEFMLGMLTARIVLSGRWIGLPLVPAILLAGASFVVTAGLLPEMYSQTSAIAFFIALLIAAGATADVRGHRTLFRSRTMIFLGEISFALYMVHWLVILYGPMQMAGANGWTAQSTVSRALVDGGLTVVITLLLAWLLYRLVERPAVRRWSRPAAVARSSPPRADVGVGS